MFYFAFTSAMNGKLTKSQQRQDNKAGHERGITFLFHNTIQCWTLSVCLPCQAPTETTMGSHLKWYCMRIKQVLLRKNFFLDNNFIKHAHDNVKMIHA